MALVDPNIAMGYRGIEVPNQLAQYGQLAQIQNAQNQNQLAQYQLGAAQRADKSQNLLSDAYSQSTDPATGKIDYNKLTGLLATGGGGAQIPAIQKSRLEQETAGTKLLADKLALLPEAYRQADTPEAYLKLHQSVHADPVIGPWLNSTGATPEKGLATLQNAIQTGTFDELRQKSMQSVSQVLEGMKPQVVAPGSTLVQGGKVVFTAPERQGTDKLADRFVPVGRLVFDRKTQQYISPSQAQLAQSQERPATGGGGGGAGATPAPKPMTAVQSAKRRDQLGKEFKTAQNALQTTQDVLDSIAFVKAEPGLSRATGFTGTLLPSIPEGAAASAETRLKNLEGKITALGKAQAASTGAIGSIANQEWKILADQIAAIDRTKGTGPLLKQLELVEAQAQGAMERMKDAYQRQFGDDFEQFPQFADLPAPRSTFTPKAPAGGKPAAGGGLSAAEQAELDQLRKRFGK
jgi:hypothetical protein